MQFTPWHRYLLRVFIGSFLVVWGIVELLLNPSGDSLLPAVLLTAGLAYLVTGVSRRRKYGEGAEHDERSRRIGVWGLSYSWYLSITIIWFFFLLDHFRLVALSAGGALGGSLVVMTLSAVVFQMYLARKGDVE